MKKFGKILVLVLSLAVALGAFVFTSLADDAPFLVEGLHRYNWAEAIDNAGGDVPVKLLSDYTVAEGESVEIKKSLTVDLNGYTVKSTNTDAPLFVVNGENVELTIKGPGSINVAGTLVKIDGDGASFVLSGGEEGINITTTKAATVFVVGGENKGEMRIEGNVNVKAKAETVLASVATASVLNIENAALKMEGSADASSPIATLAANAKVVIKRSDVYNSIGTMFTVVGPTDIGSAAIFQAEYSTITAESNTYGTVIDAADEYLTASIRVSTVRASGKAFVAAPTMMNVVSGEGADKVYQAPKAAVHITNTTYGLPGVSQDGSCLYTGNITGVITGSTLEIGKNVIAINTRLWDGENGIFVKVGTKAVGSMSDDAQIKKLVLLLTSELAAPGKDADEAVIYFNPTSATNKNFSFEDIDGEATSFYAETKVNAEHNAETYLILGIAPEGSYVVDSEWSSNFQNHPLVYRHSDGSGTSPAYPVSSGHNTRYGAIATVDSADGTNRYVRFEFSREQYLAGRYPLTANPYMGLFVGRGTKSGEKIHPTYKSDYITIDFDFTTDTEINGVPQYSYCSIGVIQRPDGSTQYQSTPNLSISGNKFYGGRYSDGKDATYVLPNQVGVWTHVTFLLQIDSSITYDAEGNVSKYNLSKSVLHVYVNGTPLGTTTVFSSSADTSGASVYEGLTLDEVRINFSSTSNIKNTQDNSLCLDNLVVTHYKNGYEGEISKLVQDKKLKLTDVKDVIYDESYQYPSPNVNKPPKMIVDDVKYYDVDKGLAAIGEGSVVELFTDVPETFNANVGFTVYKNGNKFDVTSATHYLAPIYGEVDAYKISKSNNYVPVYWDVDDFANKDKEGSLYTEMNVPFGITPTFGKTVPAGVEVNGMWREFVGWSYTKGATEADELRPISKEDVDRGYVCLYPIFAYTKTKVTFLGADGQPLGDPVWVNIGDSVADLVNYNDGAEFALYDAPAGITWYKLGFSGWELTGSQDTVIGEKPYTAAPEFERPVVTAIKQGFTLLRLTRLLPTVYVESADGVEGVEIIGVYSDASCTESMATTNVSISGKAYISAPLSDSVIGFRVDELLAFSCFVKYKVNGVEYVQKVSANIDTYLESLLTSENSSAAEKSVALEMMRFVNKSFEMLGEPGSEICERYLKDPQYNTALRDLETVSSLFSAVEQDATQYAPTVEEIKTLGYDYESNTLYFVPYPQFYPIHGGWATSGTYMLNVNIGGGGNKTRLSVGVTSRDGKFTGPLNNDSYPKANNPEVPYLVFNIDSFLVVTFYDLYEPEGATRKSLGSGKYRWANYITFLEADPDAKVNELEYARIIYSMHYSIKEAAGKLNVTPPAGN